MKTFRKITSLLTLTAFTFFMGCDVIENPIKDNGNIPVDTNSTIVLRKVLIEDLTGHRCKNCPDAAKILKDLKTFYGERVIGMAIHAGPSNFVGTTPDYPTDFTTPFGVQIYQHFKVPGLPMGLVSRKDYTPTGSSHLKSMNSWPANTAELIAKEAAYKLKVSHTYNATTRDLEINVEAEALANMSNDLTISVSITESKIIAPQLMNDNTRNENYEHNDVLRTMFTQALGDNFTTGPIAQGQKSTRTFTGKLNTAWVDVNCAIVVYVSNATTYEILQAEIVYIAP